ncbi:hypothetical protein [Roseofilum casamattae]|uniref:Uncharacterized protein n=1 Tax=Roseofilum casamattae BLCC-M143 TaxID=3022442 RepID=A0ABT7C2M4_9CYAN|nr:hypothetical protein [Roseofilum casamattae]MDJ1185302.1 hypothetical protein [Roseofilum casamattae BLCC-M143]
MNKQTLVAALEAEVTKPGRGPEEIIFLRLLKQVWEVDWTVAPYEVWTRMMKWDIPYFLEFMRADVGDEREENQLIIDWITSRIAMEGRDKGGSWKRQVCDLIDQMNRLRETVKRQS